MLVRDYLIIVSATPSVSPGASVACAASRSCLIEREKALSRTYDKITVFCSPPLTSIIPTKNCLVIASSTEEGRSLLQWKGESPSLPSSCRCCHSLRSVSHARPIGGILASLAHKLVLQSSPAPRFACGAAICTRTAAEVCIRLCEEAGAWIDASADRLSLPGGRSFSASVASATACRPAAQPTSGPAARLPVSCSSMRVDSVCVYARRTLHHAFLPV